MAAAAVVACLLLAASVMVAQGGAWSPAALLRVALFAATPGWSFQAHSFGYASAFRAWMTRGDGSGLAARVLVAAVAALVIVPASAHSVPVLGTGNGGYVQPFGLPVAAGAALFGLGMQLGNGCASVTLYAAGVRPVAATATGSGR